MGKFFKLYSGRHIPKLGVPLLVVGVDLPKDGLYFTENAFFLPESGGFQHKIVKVSYDHEEMPKEVIEPESLLRVELATGRATLENHLWKNEHDLYMSAFCSGLPFEFSEGEGNPLLAFRLRGLFTNEMKTLYSNSRCHELKAHLKKVLACPVLTFETVT